MSGPKQLLDGVLSGASMPPNTRCGGALILVTYETYREYERAGIHWATKSDDVIRDGRKHPARVFCRDEVLTLTRRGHVYRYALCGSCSDMEARERQLLKPAREAAQ